MSVVFDVVIRRFVTVFGEPKTDRPDAMIAEYEKALDGNTSEVLNRAVDNLFKRTKFRVWPTIGECIVAVKEASQDLRSEKASKAVGPEKKKWEDAYSEWSDEAFAIADRMVKCQLGKAALKQDWLLGLHEFIRRERRYPSGFEQKEIRRQTDLINRCAAGAVDMGIMHAGLKKLAQSFIENRQKLNERIGPDIEEAEGAIQ